MTRILAVLALSCVAALPAACGRSSAENGAEQAAPAAASEVPVTIGVSAPAAAPVSAPVSGPPAAPGAPAFAALYPGATLEAPALTASSSAGPGGIATYTTDADPDAVIAFHRASAEAAGLASSMEMNQGEARAYAATKAETSANLQVVASATNEGHTSVQLSWSAGK